MADVQLSGVRKHFGSLEVIKGVDLSIDHGEFCVFVGPSGCGKSTLLRLIAGLENITGGSLAIGGKDMTRVDSANRGVAMVFQSYALYPHMTVAENISFGLRMAKAPREEIARRLKKASDQLQLTPYLDRKPSQLSGGQRQRVAIGRAIVREPDVFLFDEPLSNLDASLRVQTRIEIGRLHQELGTTMIYVTHDQVEAMTMADKIVVLSAGRIEQVGAPLELYNRPSNVFVAGFIGSPKMNFIAVETVPRAEGGLSVALPDGERIDLPTLNPATTLGIRPEHVRVGAGLGAATLSGHVVLVENLGAETMLHLAIAGGTTLIVRTDGLTRAKIGEILPLSLPADRCYLFDSEGRTVFQATHCG